MKITPIKKEKNSELIPHLEALRDFCKNKEEPIGDYACNTCDIRKSCFKHVETFVDYGAGALEDFCENAIRELKGDESVEKIDYELSFGKALLALKEGKKLSRAKWNGKGMYIVLEKPEGKITNPYLLMKTVDDTFVVWLASQTDILSDDWYVVHD